MNAIKNCHLSGRGYDSLSASARSAITAVMSLPVRAALRVPWERTLQPLETASFGNGYQQGVRYCLISGPSFSITGNGNVLWTGALRFYVTTNPGMKDGQAEVTCGHRAAKEG